MRPMFVLTKEKKIVTELHQRWSIRGLSIRLQQKGELGLQLDQMEGMHQHTRSSREHGIRKTSSERTIPAAMRTSGALAHGRPSKGRVVRESTNDKICLVNISRAKAVIFKTRYGR